jgi:hypothetical protein
MHPTGTPSPAPNRIDSLVFQQIDRTTFSGGGDQRHQFFEAQRGRAQHRLGGDRRHRLALPVGADAVGAPGRGLILGESHAVAADLDVVGQGQQRVLAGFCARALAISSGSFVRRLVGYSRLSGLAATQALAQLSDLRGYWAMSRNLLNS